MSGKPTLTLSNSSVNTCCATSFLLLFFQETLNRWKIWSFPSSSRRNRSIQISTLPSLRPFMIALISPRPFHLQNSLEKLPQRTYSWKIMPPSFRHRQSSLYIKWRAEFTELSTLRRSVRNLASRMMKRRALASMKASKRRGFILSKTGLIRKCSKSSDSLRMLRLR